VSLFAAVRSLAQEPAPPAIEITYAATPDAAAFTTYFVHVVPADGATVTSVDGRFAAGLAGAMRQVNPFGLSTVLNDNNGFIISAGENPLADSQFEFNSNDVSFVVNAGESGTVLSAALAGIEPMTGRFTLAHVVLADGVFGTWQISIVQRDGAGFIREYMQSGLFGPVNGPLTADYNGNGAVDAADYIVWRDTINQMGDTLAADGNRNGQIDAGDYDLWKANFGRSAATDESPLAAPIPEPVTGIMIVTAPPLLLLARPRRPVSPKLPGPKLRFR
jgi:hypothetical protein